MMESTIQKPPLVFIHGLFLTPKSWAKWVKHFEEKGYKCYAPAYPFHSSDPVYLRNQIDPDLGDVTLGKVVKQLSHFIGTLHDKPLLVGHSMGGLAVQRLIGEGLGLAGVCISSAPPKGLLSFKWSFLKANYPVINPVKGNSVFMPTVKWFHYAFCNTMTREEADLEFHKYVVPESRNIPRSSRGKDGEVDFRKPHAPLLFVAGEKDNIVPAALNRKNVAAYKHKDSKVEFIEFPHRSHYICQQKGWTEVAEYVAEWLKKYE